MDGKHRLALWVSFRYLTSRAHSSFVSFISYVSAIGLTLGIAVLIIVLSVMNGFAGEIKNRILGVVHHANIIGKPTIKDWERKIDWLNQYPGIESSAPYVKLEGLLSAGGRVQPVLVYGVDPKYEKEVSIVDDFMLFDTSLHNLKEQEFGIVLGSFIAESLKLSLGHKVSLVVPEVQLSITGVTPRFRVFKVVGIFDLGSELDSSLAMIHIEDANRLKKITSGEVEGIRLVLNDVFNAPLIAYQSAHALSQHTGELFRFSNWTYKYGNLFKSILMEKRLVGLLLFLIITVAAFNIISSMVMVVTEKRGDIAILRTMGLGRRGIITIFLMQGVYIGLLGCILGTGLGLLIANNVTEIVGMIERLLNIQFLSQDTYFIEYFPSIIFIEDVVFINLLAFILCIFSTIYPALRASKIDPAIILRSE